MSARVAAEGFAVDINPRGARRMLGLAEDIGAVVDTVEIDRLAVVVLPLAVGGGVRPTIEASVAQQSMCDIISP